MNWKIYSNKDVIDSLYPKGATREELSPDNMAGSGEDCGLPEDTSNGKLGSVFPDFLGSQENLKY